MLIIAHRSGTDGHPEQTIQGALNSNKLGADYIEIDLRFTLDGEIAVNHDASTGRLYPVDREIAAITKNEFLSLRRKDAPGYCPHIFEDYINSGVTNLLLHIKTGGEKLYKITDLCISRGIAEKVIFGTSSVDDCRFIRNTVPGAKILAFIKNPSFIPGFTEAGADILRLWEGWINGENVKKVKDAGKMLFIMADKGEVGLSDNESYELYKSCGADGILINEVKPAVGYFRGSNLENGQ